MKNIIKLFIPRYYINILLLILIEQIMVAASTYSLIRATQDIIDGNHSPIWFISFVILLFFPYVPGIYSRKKLEELCLSAYENFLKNRLFFVSKPTSIWAQRGRKNSYNLGLGLEGFSIIKEVAHTFFDLTTIILNILLNLLVIGLTLNYKIGVAFLIGSLISMVIIKQMSKKSEIVNAEYQDSKNIFFNFLNYSWDNILLQNKSHKNSYIHKFKSDLIHFKDRSVESVVAQEKGSVLSTYGLATPVILTSIYIFLNTHNIGVLSALLSSLPRQFQIIGNIQVLFNYYLLITGLKSRVKEVLSLTDDQEFTLDKFINFNQIYFNISLINRELNIKEIPNGKYTIRGNNGVGKSMLLTYWKSLYNEDIYLLPAHSDLWLDDQNHESLSSGERILLILEKLLENKNEKIILLDEWDANLDSVNRQKIENILNKLSSSHIVIEVRHNQSEVKNL